MALAGRTIGVNLPVSCQLVVLPRFVATVTNSVSVSGDQNDPNPANNTDSVVVHVIDPTVIFVNGFESGDTSAWPSTVP